MNPTDPSRVSCPGCSKGYRWDSKLVGRTVECRQCDARFTVPDTPGVSGHPLPDAPEEDTYELDLGEGQRHPDAPEPLAVPAQNGKCPSCNNAIKDGAVICLNCGFNLREGTVLKPTVSELTTAERKEGRIPLRHMKLVRVGMWLHLLSTLLIAGMIAAAIFAYFAEDWVLLVISVTGSAGVVTSLAGSLLCLWAPKESGGRPVLLISIMLSVTSIITDILLEIGTLPEEADLLSGLISIVATICFLAFFVQLAKFLDFPEITERAEKVLALYILLLVASFVSYLPFIGCFAGILVLGTAIYAAVLYVLLLFDLNSALSYRIAEQDD